MTVQLPIRIGTRGSQLALVQAGEVRNKLLTTDEHYNEDSFVVKVIKTSGDRIQNKPLTDIGGKGLFTKELDDALVSGSIDLAVHSLKDLPTLIPTNLKISSILPRENPLDAFLSIKAKRLLDLPNGAIIGSASIRRAAQALNLRPDLKIVNYRGNVDTRIRKLENGEVDATFLAYAGLHRLKLTGKIAEIVSAEMMLPAVAQGAIAIVTRNDNTNILELTQKLNHSRTALCVESERSFLGVLDGSCRTPIAGLAIAEENELWLRGQIISADGSKVWKTERRGHFSDNIKLGKDAGEELRKIAGTDFF